MATGWFGQMDKKVRVDDKKVLTQSNDDVLKDEKILGQGRCSNIRRVGRCRSWRANGTSWER